MLDGEENGATPLAAGGDPLKDPQEDEEDRSGDTDTRVGGQHSDEGGCHAHEDEGEHEDQAAPIAVAEVPGEKCTERAEQEADPHGGEREDLAHTGARRFEEEFAEDEAGGGGVDEEVVPLHSGTDDGGEQYAPILDRKSTRLNSSHVSISYAVFCLKKKQRRNN